MQYPYSTDEHLPALVGALAGLALVLVDVGELPGPTTDDPRELVEVAGEFTIRHSGPPKVTPIGEDRCIIELSPTFVFSGDLDGGFTSAFVIDHAGPCDQPAPERFSTDGTYAGAVLGSTGTFQFAFEGTIDEQGIATGELVIVDGSGTDALADIGGALTLTGLAGVEGRYTGTLELGA